MGRVLGRIAQREGVETILTLDADCERIDGVTCELVLDAEQFDGRTSSSRG